MEIKKLDKSSYNPGSLEAIERGCTCPQMDNNYGKGVGNGNYWMLEDCPLHGSFLIDDVPIKLRKKKKQTVTARIVDPVGSLFSGEIRETLSLEERVKLLEERVFGLEKIIANSNKPHEHRRLNNIIGR